MNRRSFLNAVAATPALGLLRPGDAEWEKLGIFEHITRPRITSAITGRTPEGEPLKGDYKFITQTARGGISEVELGELARVKGVNTSVRNFGERMVTDHTKANNELKQLAASKQAALPVELSRKERSDMDHLQKATGKDFDKAYASDMVKDHKKDLKEFQDAAKDLDDPDLRAFAQKMVPTLEEHLRMARDMEELVKK